MQCGQKAIDAIIEDSLVLDAWMHNEGLTPYEEMLRSAPADYLTNIEGDICELPPGYPVYYFIYGTLTESATLQRIIDLGEKPQMRKGKPIGYALAELSEYPALIDGEPGQEI